MSQPEHPADPLGLRRVTEMVKDIPEKHKPYHGMMKPREEKEVPKDPMDFDNMRKALEKRDGEIQATKFDMGKIRCGLYPVRAYMATCEVFTYGAEKYEEGNWHKGDGFKWSRLIDAVERHLNAFKLGVDLDCGADGSGLHVLAHAQCELAMLLECAITGHGEDDRAVRHHGIFQEGCQQEVQNKYERYEDGDFVARYNPPQEKK